MSTLSPGNPSKAIRDLRDAALEEMDKEPEGVEQATIPEFDEDHSKTPDVPAVDTDDNGVSRYPGQNSPHTGNGSGGVR